MSVQFENDLIKSLTVNGHTYPFRTEPQYAGPVFHVVYAGQEHVGYPLWEDSDGVKSLSFWGVSLVPEVEETERGLRIDLRIINRSSQTFRPDRLSIMLGVDTYMDEYPAWNEKVFPTMLRCEKTHLWGYFRSPDGHLLGVASPDPIPSWFLEYNQFFSDNGHRIYTVRLDLITDRPLPGRHPAITALAPGEEMHRTIELFAADSLADVARTCSVLCRAPVFLADRLIAEPDETVALRLFSPEKPELPDGLCAEPMGDGEWRTALPARKNPGRYSLTASAGGHVSELTWCVRRPWSFYMNAARQAAYDMPQKTGSHAESWYGFFSAFQAARYMPDPELDRKLLDQFDALLNVSFDPDKGEPVVIRHRIQNTAIAASLCEDAWRVSGDIKWLERAARFADFLIDNCQHEDGAFYNGDTHYTCVIYIAKSVLEVYLAERELDDPIWAVRAEKHFAAARRATADLVLNLDNIGTEGEGTFEDGMISCSMTQISMMALLLPEEERAPYIEAAETMLEKHRCLERLGSADARSRNTTLRFWEAQYDVLIPANMINSPHGWSGWKIYGVWYLYLLTGKPAHLIDAMETLGSCAQLIDENGTLRWAFVPDPCIEAGFWKPDADGNGYLDRCTFGETYVDMISGWYRAPENTNVFGYLGDYPEFSTDQGGCCDNDVHECFKALAEVALPYGYVWEEDGALHALNGTVAREDGEIVFTPAEAVVKAVHFNLAASSPVRVRFAAERAASLTRGWLYDDGHVSSGLPTLY